MLNKKNVQFAFQQTLMMSSLLHFFAIEKVYLRIWNSKGPDYQNLLVSKIYHVR